MKKDHIILIPDIDPTHFALVSRVLGGCGFRTELLDACGKQVIDKGLEYLSNDDRPASALAVGRFIKAMECGRYDPHMVSLMLFAAGDSSADVIRGALDMAGYGFVPTAFLGLHEKGDPFTVSLCHRLMYAVSYADLLTLLKNQCKPYEIKKGEAEALAVAWTERLAEEMASLGKLSYKHIKENYKNMILDFASIPRIETSRPKVGVVGRIPAKYYPVGNRSLEEILTDGGAEVILPLSLDFWFCCLYNNIVLCDGKIKEPIFKTAYNFLCSKQKDIIDIIKQNSDFEPPVPFDILSRYADASAHGDWLSAAEILAFADRGISNVICTQPLGNNIGHVEKSLNIIEIDYKNGDAEEQIRLMLASSSK